MATGFITNTLTDSDGDPIVGVSVTAKLTRQPCYRLSDNTEVIATGTVLSNGSGVWTIELERSANLTPGCQWVIYESVPASKGGTRVTMVNVGAGTTSIVSARISEVTPPGTDTYYTADEIDALLADLDIYTVQQVNGQTGNVTLDAPDIPFAPASNFYSTENDVDEALEAIGDYFTSGVGNDTFVYDSSGVAGGNIFTDWATLIDALALTAGPKSIQFVQDETIPSVGMPVGGWDLNLSTFIGVGSGVTSAVRVTFPTGVKIINPGYYLAASGILLYSTSTTFIYDVTSEQGHILIDDAIIASKASAFVRVSATSGTCFLSLRNGSAIVLPSSLSIAGGDYESVNVTGAGCTFVIAETTGALGLGNNVIRGGTGSTMLRVVMSMAVPSAIDTGSTQTNAVAWTTLLASQSSLLAFDGAGTGHTMFASTTNVYDALDTIGGTSLGDRYVLGYTSNDWINPAFPVSATATALVSGRIYYVPVYFAEDTDITAIAADVTAAGAAASVITVALYTADSGRPGTKVGANLGTIACDAIATATASVTRTISRGMYFLGAYANSTPTVRTVTNSNIRVRSSSAAVALAPTANTAYIESGVSALPATATPGTISAFACAIAFEIL